jgi:hypothetical protein
MRFVTLGECPAGLFLFDGALGFKSEYKTESQSHPGFWQCDAYVVESGEYFWGGASDAPARERLLVTPLEPYLVPKPRDVLAYLCESAE